MLYNITDRNSFKKCLEHVETAYWPEKIYLDHKADLKLSEDTDDKENIIEQIKEKLKNVVKQVSDSNLYRVINSLEEVDELFPFLHHFHNMFLDRQWCEPYEDPVERADEIFRLHKCTGCNSNYSSNYGNYNHFVNVVAALARFIMYFKEVDHIRRVFQDRSSEYSSLVYEKDPSMRTFKLMLAGFWHDIGKSVNNPRHATEGKIILESYTTLAQQQLDKIVKTYNPRYEFKVDDLQFVSELVFFHDHYGTVGTGEDSYLPLVSIINMVKKYSLKHLTDKKNYIEWSKRYLFDLWLLNVADIMVSLEHKYEGQSEWLNDDQANDNITKFLDGPNGGSLIHDFKITLDLLNGHSTKIHLEDLSELERKAHEYSKRHALERLRRLVVCTLMNPLKKYLGNKNDSKLSEIAKYIDKFSKEEWIWTSKIDSSIRSMTSTSEFIHRFSWIGRMDYALGFFEKIASAALDAVNDELNEVRPRTGWIRVDDDTINSASLPEIQAQFFIDNYMAIIM